MRRLCRGLIFTAAATFTTASFAQSSGPARPTVILVHGASHVVMVAHSRAMATLIMDAATR